jgi:hypothetical protein
MKKHTLVSFIVFGLVVIGSQVKAQCTLTLSDYTEAEVKSCLSACGCSEIVIPTGTTVNMTGDWDLTSEGAILFTIEGTGSLVFSRVGADFDELIMASGSVLIIEDTSNTNALVSDPPAGGQTRITIGSTEYTGNDFQDIIAAGGADENGVLPIELLYFSGKKAGKTTLLKWATASEENFDYFKVQRAVGTLEFESIGEVIGAGVDNYSILEYEFVDERPQNGINYYRLKSIDLDGTFEYSNIQAVQFVFAGRFEVYPNPNKGKSIGILLNDFESDFEYVVYDNSGLIVHSGNIIDNDTNYELPDLKTGVYYVRLLGRGDTSISKLVVH